MINIELFSVGSRGEFYLNIAWYVGVKPVIQPIRAKNIYKSSPF